MDKKSLKAPEKLKVLFTIIQREKVDFYLDILETFEVNVQNVIYGKGTAPSQLYHLGIGDISKAVIISFVREDKIKEILSTLEERFYKTKNGKGIAFTVPISSLIGVTVYQLLSNKNLNKEGE